MPKNAFGAYIRHALLQALVLVSVFTQGLMVYTALGRVTNSGSPVVVVLSGSMEPAFHRGDILFLTNWEHETYSTGDVVVYKIPGAAVPIVHRVLETHDILPSPLDKSEPNLLGLVPAPDQLMLTKGDNNPVDDTDFYRGVEWLQRRNIIGRVRGFLPYLGYLTIYFGKLTSRG